MTGVTLIAVNDGFINLTGLAAACFALASIAATVLPTLAETQPSVEETKDLLATDEALRSGMVAIRDLVRLNHSLITHRRMPPDHAIRFAAAIRVQADEILATTSVSGASRERLREMLDEIVTGVEAVSGRDAKVSPIDGLVQIDEVLAIYPREFNHPGWAPVQSLDE